MSSPISAQTYNMPQLPQLQVNNPFFSSAAPPQQPNAMYPSQTFQAQRPDKASIMALYNMPQVAPETFHAQPEQSHDPVLNVFVEPDRPEEEGAAPKDSIEKEGDAASDQSSLL